MSPVLSARHRSSWLIPVAVAVLALAVALPFVVGSFFTFQLTMVMIYAIAIIGLNLLTGFNGQLSLGHAAFYAIGAYTAAILMGAGTAYYLLSQKPPTLVVSGKNDILFTGENQLRYREVVPNAEIQLTDSGHCALADKGEEIAKRMHHFLGRVL
jgi:pimeloyl-ACP methyl ester carboxylesterase